MDQIARPRRRRQTMAPRTVSFLLRRQEHRCAMCKNELNRFDREVDHIIPLSLHGSDDVENLQVLCGSCHNMKTHEDRVQYRAHEAVASVPLVGSRYFADAPLHRTTPFQKRALMSPDSPFMSMHA